MALDFEAICVAAEAAADAARGETLPRFRRVGFETKADGSPVTEADKAAERAIRATLGAAFPDFGIRGEEYGGEAGGDRPQWLVDPIDGTIGFSRGIPLFTTLISLIDEGEPVFGLIDCPALDERYVGWKGGGCRRNGEPTRVSDESDPRRAIVSHGDPFCFELWGAMPVFERMARECALLRGYTDAFGHAQVLGGGIAAMVDLHCNAWDLAPVQVLAPEAGGRCVTLPERDGKLGVVFGNPELVETLAGWFEAG
ncbi:MAG: inositol monophosphatase family protein [Myxococcota bacterium]|mgnify:CR=1 FL=1|jgi:myo-inositol-1(or 4)-monophosphatase|nr:histidinol phosphate phosphatase [Deltaproteobacteria bacterium]MCP4241966.1 histidinol phosphate phosphatase [bacterium]MDP6075024.1 inositol monophosphatase family protein [Myxococcota bacterium]MBT38646.1 histidinol phosphate phosphatase [Deltaproteobacteria bacterium]MDP7076217.1 inositol monophosphatase family protein [Myxococcota bacterium]